jgi:hypothetical protein
MAGWDDELGSSLDLEAQPNIPATATVETNTPIADIFFIVLTGLGFDRQLNAILNFRLANH